MELLLTNTILWILGVALFVCGVGAIASALRSIMTTHLVKYVDFCACTVTGIVLVGSGMLILFNALQTI